jgi:hypothetical protein
MDVHPISYSPLVVRTGFFIIYVMSSLADILAFCFFWFLLSCSPAEVAVFQCIY